MAFIEKPVEQVREEVKKIPSHFARGFLSGLGWAFGATIGFAIIFGIITFILAQLGALPLIGQFFSDLNQFVRQFNELRDTLPR